jgi:hypothetical protein
VIFAQDITDNTQSDSVDNIRETGRTYTRNKKKPKLKGQ